MFTQSDFDVFSIPGFEARMPQLRAQITPKLKEMASIITPRLEEATGLEFYGHVAMHMRRTVNPPVETWAAFCRSSRAYKPFVHTRLAINGNGIKIVLHVEDDADDKVVFAKNLLDNAAAAVKYLEVNPQIHSWDLRDHDENPLPGNKITETLIADFAKRLLKVRGQHTSFVIPIDRSDAVVAERELLAQAAVNHMQSLLPFYRIGLKAGETI